MGYDTIKTFKADRKALSITGTSISSNSYDAYGRKIKSNFSFSFETESDFEDKLIAFADGHLDGVTQFYPTSTFAKRVAYLARNNMVDKTGVKDTKKARDILSGKTKIKHLKQNLVLANKDGYVLKITRTGVRLNWIGNKTLSEVNGQTLSKLNQEQVDTIKKNHKDFLERYNIETVAIA